MNTIFLRLLGILAVTAAQTLVDPPSRECRELGTLSSRNQVTRPVPQYVAGEIITARVEVPEVDGGILAFYLCPEVGVTDEEECLLKMPLKLKGERQGHRLNLTKTSAATEYNVQVVLPDDVICDSCTLMWEMVARECDPVNELPCVNVRTSSCADVTIAEVKEQEVRIWDFLKGVARNAVQGAVRKVAGCPSNNS
ncbi:uncharacterized protein [Panulirus ornatus]|uniref:uncharacterized protein n=1 Tax=Panulirus ornatus TaxID=150431 RepID=UPI003A8B54A4